MFLNSSLPSYAVAIIIVVVAVQYALALFCLLKLAYLDIPKKQYVLWNVFILLIFFIGAAVFLVYYSKVKDTKKIPPYVEEQSAPQADADGDGRVSERSEATEQATPADATPAATENDGTAENDDKADGDKQESGDTAKD